MSTDLKANNYDYKEERELLKSLHDFLKNFRIGKEEKNENILIKYLKNKQIIKDSESLSLFIQELSKQIEKGNNIILPFIDPCYDLIEAYINCSNDKEKEIFQDNSIFKRLIENSFINRKNLIPIYSYFTEIYSEVEYLTEKDEKINKFQKISNLWNLFYSLSEDKTKTEKSLSSFCFIGSGLQLSGIKDLPENIILVLKVDFLNSKFMHYIKKNDDLISSKDYFMKYSKIIDVKMEDLTSIEFIIADKKIKININTFPIEQGGPLTDDRVNILNNFYGQIKSLELKFYKKNFDNSEKEIYSKSIFPFPLKKNNVIFKSKFQIGREKFLEQKYRTKVYDTEISDLNYDIYDVNKGDNVNELQIALELKGQDSDLIKVNYVNYKEEKFNIIDYFGGIVQFLPFLKMFNRLYRNKKILDKIGNISFIIDFINNILLIIFTHINNSGLGKQENFKVYWNFYFYILNKIELFKDIQPKIDIHQFLSYNLDNNKNKSYFEMFRLFLEFINSKNKDTQKELKNKFSESFFNEKEEDTNIIRSPQLYRHLMKQLFVYNRLWSKKYLFFETFPGSVNDKSKKIKIKYKRISNYTCNFQQPLIYPILEINKYYPKFKRFELNNLYKKNCDEKILNYEFSIDIYNNNLNDSLVENFLEINLDINNKKINNKKKYYCCLIKKMYHIKGEMRAISSSNSKSKIKIIFIPNINEIDTSNKNTKKNEENNNSNLCYGSVFKCLEKEKKRLLIIPLDKVLFILLRVYYYRNSGLEIFTVDNKSYYFNFNEDLKKNGDHEIIQIFYNNLNPIKNSENITLGWFNNDYTDLLNPLFNEDIFKWDKKNYFYSNFDKLMIINIFSNRSFNDLNQYPVFPMLYNEIGKARNLEQHIGFQEITKESKDRKELIKESYIYAQNYCDDESNEDKYYFNIMYSNITFTCNYLIRVFPYSFIAIEYQGDGFDDPNRLFYSIKSTFYNTLSQRGDLRELIPEMFYFPPLFYNKNNIELKKLSSGNEIDSVNIEDFKEGGSRKYTFLRDMRKYLNEAKINSWIDLIFGVKKDFFKDNERYYKKQSNISFKCDIKNTNYDLLMREYDFGVQPIQILKQEFPENPKISELLKKEINTLNKIKFIKDHINCLLEGKESFICKGEKGINKKYLKIINKIQKENLNFFSKLFNKIKEESENTLKYLFVGDVFGSLSVYKKVKNSNKFDKDSNSPIKEISLEKKIIDKIENHKKREYELIKSLNDHTSEIKYIDYNPRLNLVVDYGLDGFINLYTMPQLKLIHSIQIKDYWVNEPINYVVLMSNPFPMICCISSRHIIIFDINGELVNTINIEENAVLSFYIDKNCGLFNDYISHYENAKELIFPLIPDKNDYSLDKYDFNKMNIIKI